MKIAQVAPLYESVPPKLYGGTERVVSYLTEELINQGHEVTLFASGDSTTKARLAAACAQALRLDTAVEHPLVHYIFSSDQVLDEVEQCDIVHFHIGYRHFPPLNRQSVPHITTVYDRVDIDDLAPLYKR